MKNLRLLLLIVPMLLVGCASNPMQIRTDQKISPISQGKSQVVFMRSSFVGSAINASLYDVTSGEPVFIGIIADGTKIAYDVLPGNRTFMVVSEAADFLEADLNAGKTYYSLVTPRMGFWKARFSLWPIKKDKDAEYTLDSDDFKKWYLNTKLVENTDKSLAWFSKNTNSVKAKYAEYWPVWQQKEVNEMARRTLNQGDGQ
jgi:hypothetical protein